MEPDPVGHAEFSIDATSAEDLRDWLSRPAAKRTTIAPITVLARPPLGVADALFLPVRYVFRGPT